MSIQKVNTNNNISFGRLKRTKQGNEYNSTNAFKKGFGIVGALGGALAGTAMIVNEKIYSKNMPKAIGFVALMSAVSGLLSTFPLAAIIDAVRNSNRKNRADENARLVKSMAQNKQ